MDWERAYREDETPWDLRAPSPPLEALLESGQPLHWGLPEPPRVLVPGCGRGHDLRLWAEVGARATGYDLSPQAVSEARGLLALNQVEARVEVRDLLGLSHTEDGSFDLIYDAATFCSFAPALRSAYGQSMARLLAPGGVLLMLAFPFQVEHGRPGRPPFRVDRADLYAALEPPLQLERDWPVAESVPPRKGLERWFLWRARGV